MPARFAFVVPLRNPARARQWSRTVALCLETLRSLAEASDARCDIILSCREFPDVDLPPNVTILRHPFPDPEPTNRAQGSDKYSKIKLALAELRRREHAYHVMRFDADDLVHRDLPRWVLEQGRQPGFLATSGWTFDARHRLLKPVAENFDLICGSTNCLYATPDDLPRSLDDERPFDLLDQGHGVVASSFAARRTPLVPIPFPAVVYRRDTGENLSQRFPAAAKGPRPNWKYHVGRAAREVRDAARSRLAPRVGPDLARDLGLDPNVRLVR